MKQLHLQDSAEKDVIERKINPLLASMKFKRIEREFNICKMSLKLIAYVQMDESSPVRGHWFAFFDKSMSLSRNNLLQMGGMQTFDGEGRPFAC